MPSQAPICKYCGLEAPQIVLTTVEVMPGVSYINQIVHPQCVGPYQEALKNKYRTYILFFASILLSVFLFLLT